MKLIVAVDENWGIGKKGKLLKSIPDDMRFFREKTKGAILVMGYNTLLSFPGSKPLPGRLNIVLADIPDLTVEGAVVCSTMEELLALLENFRSDDIFVIGGGMMYRQMMPYCDTALITKMRFSGDADTFIPNLDSRFEWSVADESELKEYEGINYSFAEYRNASVNKLDYRSFDTDLPGIFADTKELTFRCYECGGAYCSELKELLYCRFYPIRDGVSPSYVRLFLSTSNKEEQNSFGHFLHFKRLTATVDDFEKLNDRFWYKDECTGKSCQVCVRKAELDEFIELLDEGAPIERISERFGLKEQPE